MHYVGGIMETKINQAIKSILLMFGDKYFIGEIVNKQKVIQDLDNYDKELMTKLLSNDVVKSNFTMAISDAIIFNVNKLIELFETNDYWQDSYTKYSKKIGLTANGKFIDEATEIVLDFPYKDTVLKAGMTKEDLSKDDLRPDEPFLNEVIAKEEIDVLLDKKLLVDAKKYDAEGEHDISEITEEDNLILKGNNLLALHSLKERYAGKVKLIYIDPPYNTGNDSFQYNDRFNHSAWLTFMKNRLEISKELLSEDGIISIQTDYHENSYIRVLMDEIFGRNNFISEVSIQMSTASGPKMANIKSSIPKLKDSLIIFSKGKFEITEQPYKPKNKWDKEYSKILMDFTKKDRELVDKYLKEKKIKELRAIIEKTRLSTISKEYPSKTSDDKWKFENSWRIVADKQNTGLDNLLSKSPIFWNGDISVAETKTGNLTFFRTDKDFGKDTRVEIIFADNNLNEHVGDIWTDISTSGGFSDEGGIKFPTAKKPEKLLARIIGMFTKENDMVLDFFMGSATTQAVAMKMKRRFIGIEQMDYIKAISIKRLVNVINSDQTGISRNIDWQGGGSFIYAELMEKNTGFLKEIIEADTMQELQAIFERMSQSPDIDFRVDLEEVKVTLWEHSLEEQKKTLIKILDKNQLYFNYSEIDDAHVRELVSDSDYAFNQSFYKEVNQDG